MSVLFRRGLALLSARDKKLPDLQVFGRSTKQREDGLAKDMIDEAKFRKDTERLRLEREAKGEGSLYLELQPFYTPELSELKGRRIDVLVSFDCNEKGKKQNKKGKEW